MEMSQEAAIKRTDDWSMQQERRASGHCRVAFGHFSKHLKGVGNRGEARLDREAMQQEKGIIFMQKGDRF